MKVTEEMRNAFYSVAEVQRTGSILHLDEALNAALAKLPGEPVAAYTIDHTGCEHLSRDVANIRRIAAVGAKGPTDVGLLYAAPPAPAVTPPVDIVAALVRLAEYGVPVDIQEALVRGSRSIGIRRGALAAALSVKPAPAMLTDREKEIAELHELAELVGRKFVPHEAPDAVVTPDAGQEVKQNYNCPCIHPSQCDNSCLRPAPAVVVKPEFTKDTLARMITALFNSNCANSQDSMASFENINFNVLLEDLFNAAHSDAPVTALINMEDSK